MASRRYFDVLDIWISGKAGSGKSTLMAHIVEDERTHEDLNLWRDGCTLNVLSFFLNGILACATWKELVPDRSMAIMTRLIYILGALVGALQPWCIPPFGPPFHEKLPEPLFALMEMTELYVAPEFGLKRIFIQISAEAWARFCYSAFPTADTTGEGSMASHVSAVQVRRAVRILCVPSFKGRAAGSRDRSEVEQGLDGGQQLITTACVIVGLLGAEVEYRPQVVYHSEYLEYFTYIYLLILITRSGWERQAAEKHDCCQIHYHSGYPWKFVPPTEDFGAVPRPFWAKSRICTRGHDAMASMRRLLGLAGAALLAVSPASTSPLERRQTISFQSTGNPILADGSYYSGDPAPIVVNNTVYIISGRDQAGATENNFGINQWQIFESADPNPSGGSWTLHANVVQPQTVFSWARSGTAYAAQVVRGGNGKFYLYAPVTQSRTSSADPFAIGVAVSDNILGPYTDAHPSGPIISQSVPSPGNNIQNIDPTVLVDDDGRVYIYFGTFGQLLAYELNTDMVTIKSTSVTRVSALTGFFEAPWLMKRKGTYYMLYAGNNAGPNSPCTPTSYHACIAYGTASSPLGPWTYRGIVLDIVSSTTSHPGVFTRDGGSTYYLVYHTRDATGGTHFRRSIALDKLEFDDSASPPAIKKVTQTHRATGAAQPTRNIAPRAKAASANTTPIQYWVEAIHDGRVEANPLPPDYWCSYAAEQSPQSSTLTYTWDSTVQLNGVAMAFFADQPAGSNIGVPPPASWRVEYLNSAGAWTAVSLTGSGGYPTAVTNSPPEVSFQTVSTTALRAVLTASGNGQFGGVGVKEWFAYAPTAS
ncbi:hypothetical protein CIB48_g7641 [Xylaria polymorpha]|nr:hypothetical protein CIB48_g7641 [Xylaria polymorpha]